MDAMTLFICFTICLFKQCGKQTVVHYLCLKLCVPDTHATAFDDTDNVLYRYIFLKENILCIVLGEMAHCCIW